MNKFTLSFSLFFLIISVRGYGQCCSAGNPAGGDGSNDGLSKNELRIFASYKYSLSKDYFHNNHKTTVPYMDKSFFDYSMISLTYGLLAKLSLHSEFGYFYDKTQQLTMNYGNEIIKSHGFGDFAFSVRYIALKTVKPVSQLVFSGGLILPVGEFNEEIDGITIPVSLQPSSGAMKYNAGIFYKRKWSDRKIGWNSYILFEMSNKIDKGFLVYKYGNFLQFSVGGTCQIVKNLDFAASFKYEWRAHDRRESNMIIESSGSSVLFFNPQFMYFLKHKWTIILRSDIPVYKFVNGYQLTNKFSFQLGLRKSLMLCQ